MTRQWQLQWWKLASQMAEEAAASKEQSKHTCLPRSVAVTVGWCSTNEMPPMEYNNQVHRKQPPPTDVSQTHYSCVLLHE